MHISAADLAFAQSFFGKLCHIFLIFNKARTVDCFALKLLKGKNLVFKLFILIFKGYHILLDFCFASLHRFIDRFFSFSEIEINC